MMLAKLMKTQTWYLPVPAGWVRGETMASASISFWEKAAPSTLTLKPDSSCMSLVFFQLLPRKWSSEQVSPVAS